MKFQNKFMFIFVLIASLFVSAPVFAQATPEEIDRDLSYCAHVCNLGWMDPVRAGETAGTVGQALPLEAFRVYSNLANFKSEAHVRNLGWQPAVDNAYEAGTTGQGLPIEAVKITIDNPDADVYYRIHAANFGWLGWAKNGEVAGTTGCAFPAEAIEIRVVPKGAQAPGDTANAVIDRNQIEFKLKTYVSGQGWTDPVNSGLSGTTGQGLPIEAIELTVTDPLGKSGAIGQAYVAEEGWQGPANKNDAIGTTGKGHAIEAFRYHLVGPAAAMFELNYHAHSSNVGWLGWTSRNETAGTANGALPVEAVEIALSNKGFPLLSEDHFLSIETPLGIIPPAPTCIVINKATQMMAFYQNYKVTRQTNVVTGMAWCDDTKSGDWRVEEKLPGYRTVGPGYDAVVSYWLTLYVGDIYGFDGGHIVDRVGIHDAGWRTNWGSNAYLNDGSHGCVNTPYAAMKYIFDNVPQGAPVRIR